MERLESRSFERMASAALMKVSTTLACGVGVGTSLVVSEGASRMTALRWLMALVRSTAVGRLSLR